MISIHFLLPSDVSQTQIIDNKLYYNIVIFKTSFQLY